MPHTLVIEGNVNEVEVIREDLRLILNKASQYGAEYGFEVSMVISIIGRQLSALYDLADLVENDKLQSNIIDMIGECEFLLKTLSTKLGNNVFIEISDAVYMAKTYLLK